MPSSRTVRLPLGESWVVEGEDEHLEQEQRTETAQTKNEEEPISRGSSTNRRPSRHSPRQRPKRTPRTPDPEFIMPSLDSSSMVGSWVDAAARDPRPHRNPRDSDARRRSSRQELRKDKHEKTTGSNPSPRTPPHTSDSSGLVGLILDTTFWTFDILGKTFKILKTPIAYLLAVWVLFGMGIVLRNLVTTSIYTSLSPICRIPGTSYLNLPFCPKYASGYGTDPATPVEFDQLMIVQSKFEEVLQESAGSVSLPMDMKRGEASIRDLRQVVKYSQLDSKNELVLEFDGFIDTARIASYDLQKFNSHIGRAVDSVLATTKWTTRVLDGIMIRDATRGRIAAFVNDQLLAPFQPVRFTESALLDQYIKHAQTVEEEIQRLIIEAEALLSVLVNLENRLDIIHGVVTRDDAQVKAKKEEILSELWSLIGGNRGRLNSMDRQLHLLKQVTIYRQAAYAHVAGTILKLQAIGAGLEDLRERVGAPGLLRDRSDVPLSVHLDNIQRGVERLEQSRESAKKVENEHIRRTLERGQKEGTLIDG